MAATSNLDLKTLGFDTFVVNESEQYVKLRAKLSSSADANDWLAKYKRSTNTHWVVRKTNPELIKLSYRKNYVCHHAAVNRVVPNTGRAYNWTTTQMR